MVDFTIPPEVAGRNIATMLRERAAQYPTRVAIMGCSPRLGEVTLTYAQLSWRARRFADALHRQGVRRGDRVGVMLDNAAAIEFAVSSLAVHELGAVHVPMSTRYALEEIVYVTNKAGLKALVATESRASVIEPARARIPTVSSLIVVRPTANEAPDDWYALYAQARVQRDHVPPANPGDLAEILFTSGTTAHPKGAMMTHQSSLASCYSMVTGYGIQSNETWQTFMPVYTTGGNRCVALACWFAGAMAVFDPELDIGSVLDRMERARSSVYVGSPAFYIFLLDEARKQQLDLTDLRVFLYGGAPSAPENIRRLHATFPHVELRHIYSPTETGPGGVGLSGSELLANPSSVGKVWPLVEIKIVDEEDRTLPAGEAGEVCTRGPCIMTGYFGEPEKSTDTLKGGWHHTGDIGTIDEAGNLYIVDRKKDMIIRGGNNVASVEVESVLAQHPAVVEAAVVGVPHDKLGEDVFAFIKVRDGHSLTLESLRAFCSDKLADYKTPRKMSLIDTFPRNTMGKILKPDLREMARRLLAQPNKT